ncbi:hypothetical protein C2G38_2254828 [Gigaspora rosea]|uniref:MARVEL domain-containing protein n=1 Tax=Gigaspora rosea TaxID=44941 RepID=A0A397U235_9GLOM|nr:hypothetical protein C2G38_2254828 [Gigaspora rosea]
MDLYTRPHLFWGIKILQLLLALTCLGLEITQIVAFSSITPKLPITYFYDNYKGFGDYGVKIFYYFVILITIIGTGWYLIYFNNLWRNPLLVRDIGVDISFAILWLISGLTIISPVYHGINSCMRAGHSAHIIDCQAYFASIFCCWLNSILFAITSLFSWKLSSELRFRGATSPTSPRSFIV